MENNNKKKRVLVTFFEAGFGHVTTATSIADSIEALHDPSIELIRRYTFHDDPYFKVARAVKDGIDGLVVGSPVYYGGPNGSLCALLDRVFYSLSADLKFKPAASVVVCRRGGASASFDRLNKYFTMTNMPVVSSQYWNMVYGQTPGQAALDEEGMQTMRTLGRNMAWMVKSLNMREKGHPQEEPHVWTNFIR